MARIAFRYVFWHSRIIDEFFVFVYRGRSIRRRLFHNMHLQSFNAVALLARGGGNGMEVHNEALAVEVSNVITGDFDRIAGIVLGL